jgi:hypothetical protein
MKINFKSLVLGILSKETKKSDVSEVKAETKDSEVKNVSEKNESTSKINLVLKEKVVEKTESEKNVSQLSGVLKDMLPKHHINILSKRIGKEYLNREIPLKADNLIEGEWTLTKDEKDEALEYMFSMNNDKINRALRGWNPSKNFIDAFNNSSTSKIDIMRPSLLDVYLLNDNIFNLISVGETRGNRVIVKGEDGRPIYDENKKPIYREKPVGEIVYSGNKSNFNGFYANYTLAFPDDVLPKNPFTNSAFTDVKSFGVSRNFDPELFKNDLQLYISGKPEDLLNISVSKFYDSCQNLYSGSHNQHLPVNIFDTNVKVAYLKFNVPFTDSRKNIVPFTIFSRCLIRNIKGEIFFDVVYPGQLSNFLKTIITKYTGMVNNYKGRSYYYTPCGLGRPYMDSLQASVIASNTEARKDNRLMLLATALNHNPEDIWPSPKNAHTYICNAATYKVLDANEADIETYNFLTNDMIYKQDVYKKYVDIQAFYNANIENEKDKEERLKKEENEKKDKDKKGKIVKKKKVKSEKLLRWYTGAADFDEICKWADEQPYKKIKKKDGTVERIPDKDKKCRITKHDLYRAMKPFIDPVFFAERTTPEQIIKKRNKISKDDTIIELKDGYFAFRAKDEHPPHYNEDGIRNNNYDDDYDDYDDYDDDY